VLYRPVEIPDGVDEQVDVLCRAADLTLDAMHRLRTPQELHSYWVELNPPGPRSYWVEINRLENEGDQAYRRLLATLFSGMYEPLELLKLKDVVEELEAAADAFGQVGHTAPQIAAEERFRGE